MKALVAGLEMIMSDRQDQGVPPSGSGHSASPEPVVSALRASVPNAVSLTANELLALKAWAGTSEDYGCIGFKTVAEYSGLSPHLIRRTVRSMARKGVAEFHSGLCDDDGNFRGSGYGLTKLGRDLLWQHYEDECWKYEGY